MSLSQDLLQQAKHLLDPDPGKPRQANLRRSISTAYYSLFSLLVTASAEFIVDAEDERQPLHNYMTRAFSHEAMMEVCKGFAQSNPKENLKEALADHAIPGNLAYVAEVFRDLQEAHKNGRV